VFDFLSTVIANFSLRDFVDLVLVYIIVYRVLILIRGTRAVQMMYGLFVFAIAFFASMKLELFTLHWVFSHFFEYSVLIIIILFQDEIRRALTHVGRNPFLLPAGVEERAFVDEITRATTRLKREGIGALIVLERETGLKNFTDTGSILDAKMNAELLYSIFLPQSPIHDGAAIISDGRLAAAGCFLPLSKNPNLDRNYGTRHRAAIGLTEDTDAIVILVSEENRAVHLVRAGRLTKNLNESELRETLSIIMELMSWTESSDRSGSTKEIQGKSTSKDEKDVIPLEELAQGVSSESGVKGG
jgi:uncharacterized protein (TIGR00159 family)